MSKFTFEEKLCAEKSYLNGEAAFKTIAKQFGTSSILKGIVKRWISVFPHVLWLAHFNLRSLNSNK